VTNVAIKSIKPGSDGDYVRAAMKELKVMIFLKQHENVVEVFGACTKELINRKCSIKLKFS